MGMRAVSFDKNVSEWMLDPNIHYLNHGSFGARRLEIFEKQVFYKEQFERDPIDFLDRNEALLESSRANIAYFLGASLSGFGFVDNATTGVGSVMNSVSLSPGDEVATTNHVYNGVRQLLKHHARKNSLLYREIPIQIPIDSSEHIIKLITKGLSDKTKLLVIDHVASASSILFPVLEITKICRERGILVLVDGAHAPGMLDLNISSLDPDWYVGNLHKWICSPLGAAFVWANETKQKTTRPLTISHNLDQGMASEFSWQGTRDISAWLCASDAVLLGQSLGWDKIRSTNHNQAVKFQEILTESWNVMPFSPLDGCLIGSMVTVELPNRAPQEMNDCLKLSERLYREYNIEIPIFEFQNRGCARISSQLYVTSENLNQFIDALREIIHS